MICRTLRIDERLCGTRWGGRDGGVGVEDARRKRAVHDQGQTTRKGVPITGARPCAEVADPVAHRLFMRDGARMHRRARRNFSGRADERTRRAQGADPRGVGPIEVCEDHLILTVEVLVERVSGNVGLGDDRVHPDASNPVGIEEPERGLEDPFTRARLSGHRTILKLNAMVRPDQDALVLSEPLYDGLYEYHKRANLLGREAT